MKKKKKNRATKMLLVRVQPSLYKKFKQKCDLNYKNVSECIRDLMQKYLKQ